MDEISFLKRQKPSCTYFPFYEKLGNKPAIYAELSARSVEDFGENLLGKLCPKAQYCTGPCLGRPIPKYPELLNLYPELHDLPTIEYKGKEVYSYTATLCSECPFKNVCGKPCGTLSSFLNKDLSSDDITLRDESLSFRDDVEWAPVTREDYSVGASKNREDIPWDVVTEHQRRVIELRHFWLMEWREIADELDSQKQNVMRSYQRGMKKLKNRGVSILEREELEKSIIKLYSKNNLTSEEICGKVGIKRRIVERVIQRYLEYLGE